MTNAAARRAPLVTDLPCVLPAGAVIADHGNVAANDILTPHKSADVALRTPTIGHGGVILPYPYIAGYRPFART